MTTVIFHSYVSLPEGMPRTAWFYTPPGSATGELPQISSGRPSNNRRPTRSHWRHPQTKLTNGPRTHRPVPAGVGKNGIPFYPGNFGRKCWRFLNLKVSIPFGESLPMLTMNWDFVPLCNVTGKTSSRPCWPAFFVWAENVVENELF